MRTDQFDFDLPEDLIALRPVSPRDAARLLVVHADGRTAHHHMGDLPGLLRAGDIAVVNDTKVIPARLFGTRLARGEKSPGAKVEVTLFSRTGPASFRALARPAKRLKPGDRLLLGQTLQARIDAREEGEVTLMFDSGGADLDAAIAAEGAMPLPPYIAGRRAADARDAQDYQTVYAQASGSIAAPTAGLHFTQTLLDQLASKQIGRAEVTLHVGPGTFLPVTADDTSEHKMHPEWADLGATAAERINAARAGGGQIMAVGTTATRTLESASDDEGVVHAFRGDTRLFITPGYRFRCVDIMLTNFHLPRSTLFMLVSAFSGLQTMKAAYQEAIAQRYRFYSYGDACLLFRKKT